MLHYWKRRNDEMGKAAHVGVGRLFSVDGLDGVRGVTIEKNDCW